MAVLSSLSPTIASLYSQEKKERLQRVMTKSVRLVFFFSFLTSMLLVSGREFFLSIFGGEFQSAAPPLTILVLGKLVASSCGVVGLLLSMTGHQNFKAITVASGALLNIVGNSYLIPRYGMSGAAIATASSMIFMNLFNVVWVIQKLKINPTLFYI